MKLSDPDLIAIFNAVSKTTPAQQAAIAKLIRQHILPAAKPR